MPIGRRHIVAGLSLAPIGAIGEEPAGLPRMAQSLNATVGLIAGWSGSTSARIAADMAVVTDDGDKLRVLPILGRGSIQNIADLVFLKGIDTAIVHEDSLSKTMRSGSIPRETSVQYIAKLFQEEIHILARPEIARLEDLRGKIVSVGPAGGGTELTATELLQRAGVQASLAHAEDFAALDGLRTGAIAALVVVGGKPVPLLQMIGPGSGLHFLTVPLTPGIVDAYLPTSLDPGHYPALMQAGPPVETVAVGAVLATMSASPDTQRAKRVNRFVNTLFTRIDRTRQPGFHPKWQEVNLAAQLPGWTRYPEADAFFHKDHRVQASTKKAFDAYLDKTGHAGAPLDKQQREALFQQFLRWQEQHGNP